MAAISVFHFLTEASIKVQLDLTVVSKITITIILTIRRLFQHNWSTDKHKRYVKYPQSKRHFDITQNIKK